MKRLSFSTQLVALWAMVATICAMLVAAVWFIANSADGEQVAGAKRQASTACSAVASRYSLSRPLSGTAAHPDLMHAVLDTVLAQAPGVEGGFWTSSARTLAALPETRLSNPMDTAGNPAEAGFLAYAFPTYQGSGIKRDIPQAETPLIVRALQTAAATHAEATDVVRRGDDAVVAAACPVNGETALFVWTLTRAQPALGAHGRMLVSGLAAVLAVILIVAVALALALRRWKRNLNRLEEALSAAGDIDQSGQMHRLGEPELDRIVDALNRYAARAESLRQQTVDLSVKLASAERFGMLGKLAAQIAHEIRNPAGAMRLKAENALAGDNDRQQNALRFILEQIRRIETQVASLLALTQPVTIKPHPVDVAQWLTQVVESHRELARSRGIQLMLAGLDEMTQMPAIPQPSFDADQLQRALDNLLLNALRHVGNGGLVTVSAQRDPTAVCPQLRIAVSDNGSGVPAGQRERIFEPFVTGHANGSGLGLAVVREIASAHGGRASLADTPNGACFVIEIPWQPSS
jgi:signal transduction histidine kinase